MLFRLWYKSKLNPTQYYSKETGLNWLRLMVGLDWAQVAANPFQPRGVAALKLLSSFYLWPNPLASSTFKHGPRPCPGPFKSKT